MRAPRKPKPNSVAIAQEAAKAAPNTSAPIRMVALITVDTCDQTMRRGPRAERAVAGDGAAGGGTDARAAGAAAVADVVSGAVLAAGLAALFFADFDLDFDLAIAGLLLTGAIKPNPAGESSL